MIKYAQVVGMMKRADLSRVVNDGKNIIGALLDDPRVTHTVGGAGVGGVLGALFGEKGRRWRAALKGAGIGGVAGLASGINAHGLESRLAGEQYEKDRWRMAAEDIKNGADPELPGEKDNWSWRQFFLNKSNKQGN